MKYCCGKTGRSRCFDTQSAIMAYCCGCTGAAPMADCMSECWKETGLEQIEACCDGSANQAACFDAEFTKDRCCYCDVGAELAVSPSPATRSTLTKLRAGESVCQTCLLTKTVFRFLGGAQLLCSCTFWRQNTFWDFGHRFQGRGLGYKRRVTGLGLQEASPQRPHPFSARARAEGLLGATRQLRVLPWGSCHHDSRNPRKRQSSQLA